MFNKVKKKIRDNTEIIALGLLLLTTILSTTYYNFNKQKIYNNYKNIINNIYFKKTIDHVFENLEPKFKTITHRINEGETFDKILRNYTIKEEEIHTVVEEDIVVVEDIVITMVFQIIIVVIVLIVNIMVIIIENVIGSINIII